MRPPSAIVHKPRTEPFCPWGFFKAGRREEQSTGYGARDTGLGIRAER
jgi:hypothetical protein